MHASLSHIVLIEALANRRGPYMPPISFSFETKTPVLDRVPLVAEVKRMDRGETI
jgi:hypothetical protein